MQESFDFSFSKLSFADCLGTYTSEAQLQVWDFCLSLLDLSALRQALNFSSLAASGWPPLNTDGQSNDGSNPKARTLPPWLWVHAAGMLIIFKSFFGILPLNPLIFFYHLVPHVCPSIWHIENSSALLCNMRYSEKGDLTDNFASTFSLVMLFLH